MAAAHPQDPFVMNRVMSKIDEQINNVNEFGFTDGLCASCSSSLTFESERARNCIKINYNSTNNLAN